MVCCVRAALFQCCLALLSANLAYPAQTARNEIGKILEMRFPEDRAEMRKRILALGAEGAPFVTRDIIEGDAGSGWHFARKSFLIGVVFDYDRSVSQPLVRQLLRPKNKPIVVMLTIRDIAYSRRSEYLSDLVGTFDDARVGSMIESSHYPARPVTIRAEAIEALEKIFELQLGGEDGSEQKKAELWRAWAAKKVVECP